MIAAASTEAKLAVCREHGAALTINYELEDLKTRVRELTDGTGVDVVYDPVGGAYSEPALRSIAWKVASWSSASRRARSPSCPSTWRS